MFAGAGAEQLFRDNQRIAAVAASRFAGRGCSALGLEWDDLHQIALVALWNAADTHDPNRHGARPFDSYAYAKCQHRIVDAIRTHKAILGVGEGQDEDMPDQQPGPFATAAASDLRRALRSAVRRLPPRMRTLIESRLLGKTLREIGEALCGTESRAWQIEQAAIELLRYRLGRDNGAPG